MKQEISRLYIKIKMSDVKELFLFNSGDFGEDQSDIVLGMVHKFKFKSITCNHIYEFYDQPGPPIISFHSLTNNDKIGYL